jgi:DNA-directed RNA polymerase beta subunit
LSYAADLTVELVVRSTVEITEQRTQRVPRKNPDGTLVHDANGNIAYDYIPVLGEDGNPQLIGKVIEDISENGRPPMRRRELLARIPVMLGSSLCWLRGKTPEELIEMGEDPDDPFGYYVNQGTERTINLVEQLRNNRFYLYVSKNSNKTIECTITCARIKGPQKVSIYLPEGGGLNMFIYYFGRSGDTYTTINVLHIFSLLSSMGDYSRRNDYKYQESLERILMWIPSGSYRRRASNYLLQTIVEYIPNIHRTDTLSVFDNIQTLNDTMNIIDDAERWKHYYTNICRGLFPQVPDTIEGIQYKQDTMATMCARLLEHRIGIRDVSDRDSYANKMLKTSAVTLMLKFSSEFMKTTDELQRKIAKDTNNFTNKTFVSQIGFDKKHLSDFEKALSNNKYLSKSGQNLTEVLKRSAILAARAHLLKIIVPGSDDNPSVQMRLPQPTQLGYVDPPDTPEGSGCGRIRAKASTCYITHDTHSQQVVVSLIQARKDRRITVRPTTTNWCALFHNGRMLGWCEGNSMSQYFVQEKRALRISMYTCIVLEPADRCLYVHDDGGRMTRPLLILDADEIPLFYKDKEMVQKWKQGEVNFSDLIRAKYVEYIDAWEQDGMYIDQSIRHIQERKKMLRDLEAELDQSEEMLRRIEYEDIYYAQVNHESQYMSSEEYEKYLSEQFTEREYKRSLAKDFVDTRAENIAKLLKELSLLTTEAYVEAERQKFIEDIREQSPDASTVQIHQLLTSWDLKRFDLMLELQDRLEVETLRLKEAKTALAGLYHRKREEGQDGEEGEGEEGEGEEGEEEEPEEMRKQALVNRDILQQNINRIKRALANAGKENKRTHVELTPLALMGVAAALIPYTNFNPAPRGTYQASHGKQALSVNTQPFSYPTSAAYSVAPTRPMTETSIYQTIGMSEKPAGDTVMLAIMTYGFNQEDAIVIKREAIEAGLFWSRHEYSFTTTFSPGTIGTDIKEIPGIPHGTIADKAKRRYGENVYEHLDENGIASLGSNIRPGQCVIGKIKEIIINDSHGHSIPKIVDDSEYATPDKYGIVNSVNRGKVDIKDVVSVNVYQMKTPTSGDKFGSRHAQKTTLGLIVGREDLPYTDAGMVPDMIMNPHAIPSRMTIGHIIEMVASKVAGLMGERIDASAFQDVGLDGLKEALFRHGYASHGSEVFYSGTTGEMMEGLIFTGPCYYQTLAHMASKKIQARGTGAVMPDNRQPIKGKSQGGGPRFGTMEKTALLSSGAAGLIRDRLMVASDEFNPFVCRHCGDVALLNPEARILRCMPCGRIHHIPEDEDEVAIEQLQKDFAMARIPFSLMKAKQMATGMGQKITFGF